MTTIYEVRQALGEVLSNIPDWTVGTPYVGDQPPNPYTFRVALPAFDPRYVFSQSKAQHTFVVTAYAPRTAPDESERRLDALKELSGDGSLIATVQNGSLWSVTVDYAQVTNCGAVQAVDWDTTQFLACQFEIEVVW